MVRHLIMGQYAFDLLVKERLVQQYQTTVPLMASMKKGVGREHWSIRVYLVLKEIWMLDLLK